MPTSSSAAPGYDITQNIRTSASASAAPDRRRRADHRCRFRPARRSPYRSASARRSHRSPSTRPPRPTFRSSSSARRPRRPLHAGHRHRPDDSHGQRRRVPQRDHQAGPEHGELYSQRIIPDAIITISPRSALEPGQRQQRSRSPSPGRRSPPRRCPNQTWTGTATVTVTGGPAPAVVLRLAGVPTGPVLEHQLRFALRRQSVHAVAYRAFGLQLPADSVSVALQQFLPSPGLPPADLLASTTLVRRSGPS